MVIYYILHDLYPRTFDRLLFGLREVITQNFTEKALELSALIGCENINSNSRRNLIAKEGM